MRPYKRTSYRLDGSGSDLGMFCRRIETTDPRKTPQARFTYIDISSLDRLAKAIVSPRVLVGKDAPSRARRVVRYGDVLVATTRPNLNAVALVGREFDGQICSTGICVLRPDRKALDSQYAYFATRTRHFVDSLSGLGQGAMYPAVTDERVLDQTIPLPPLSEQKRIVAILKEQMAAIGRAKKAAEDCLEAAQALREEFLMAVFESSEALSWPEFPMEDLCTISAKQVNPKLEEYKDLPHVNGENIESGSGRILYLKSSAELGMRSGKYFFKNGDVLYSKLRPYLRKAASVDFDGLCSADMYPLTPMRGRVTQEFLCLVLLSSKFTQYADDESKRSRMPKLNRRQLLRWRQRIPSIGQQHALVEQVNNRQQFAKSICDSISATIRELELLPATLLQRAFSGRL